MFEFQAECIPITTDTAGWRAPASVFVCQNVILLEISLLNDSRDFYCLRFGK